MSDKLRPFPLLTPGCRQQVHVVSEGTPLAQRDARRAGVSVRSMLVVWLFSFVLIPSFSAFSEEASDCWWQGCRVSTQNGSSKTRTMSLNDPHYSHMGLPTPPEGSNARPRTWSRRPEEKKNDNFVILECDPYKNLQEGDILLQVAPITKDISNAFDLLMLSSHAAIVAKKPDGSLYALGTPRNYWPEGKLDHTSYHIVRLREFPTEITSAKVLQEWKSSPVKYQKIKDWQEQRKQILAKVKKGIEFFEKNVPYYDSLRNTQILDPKEKEKFTRMILMDEPADDLPSQYCSELVATIYAVAGAKLPPVKANQFYIDRLEKEVIPYFRQKGETDLEVLKRGLDAFFNEKEVWLNFGVTDDEIEELYELRKQKGDKTLLPAKIKKIKDNFEWVWGFPAFIRNQLIAWGGSVGSSRGVITPFDFLDSVKDVKSDYSYAGTYLKEACDDPTKGPQLEHYIH